MNRYIDMIAERKLRIEFSNFVVLVVDSKMCYVEYHSVPQKGADLVVIHKSRYDALITALENCYQNIVSSDGVVVSKPSEKENCDA